MDVKEISLLPVNSFELDTHLANLGISLRDFAREYGFTKKCFGVEDCDFIQCVLIEFIMGLKPYAIPFFAVAKSGIPFGQKVAIKSEHHTQEFIDEAAFQAFQYGYRVPDFVLIQRLNYNFTESKKDIRLRLYELKSKFRYRKVPNQSIPIAKPGQFRLLMSTYHPNTIFTLTPIQDQLKNRSDVFQMYIANRIETYQKLLSLGYPNILFGWSLSGEEHVSFNKAVFQDFISSYFEEAFPFGQPTQRFRQKFIEKLQAALVFVQELYPKMKVVIDSYQPEALLVSSCSTTDAQILIQLCVNRGVKVVEMTHGMFYDTPTLYFQNVPVKLVWNKMQQDIMKRYRPEINCPVVGNPKHDELVRRFQLKSPKRYTEDDYILFVSSPGRGTSLSWATFVNVLESYLKIAKQYPLLKFIYKLHPSERKEKIEALVNRLGASENFIIEKVFDTYALVYHASIVVVITSSVGYEALLWDKKIICFRVPNSDRWMPFDKYNLALTAKDAEELKIAIDYFLEKPSLTLNNPDKNYFSYTDGRAIENVFDFINKQ